MYNILKYYLVQELIVSMLRDLLYLYKFNYQTYLNLKFKKPEYSAVIFFGNSESSSLLLPAPFPPPNFKSPPTESFVIYGAHDFKMKCSDILIKTNNIHLHYQGNEYVRWGCGDNELNLVANISSKVYIDYSLSVFGYKSRHFEFSGLRSNEITSDLHKRVLSMPDGSTIIDIAYTNYKVHSDIANEIFRNSFTYYNPNPYIRYINHIITIPKDATFVLNNKEKVTVFISNPHDLESYENQTIIDWQINKIIDFIDFFANAEKGLEEQLEFKMFAEQTLSNYHDIHIYVESFSYLERYKEILLFNYIYKNETQKIKDLINLEVDINCKTFISGNAVIYAAVTKNYTYEFIEYLIDQGANINIPNNNNVNALVPAIISENLDLVKFLLLKGINVNLIDKNSGNTPLHFAVAKGNCQITELLLSHQADASLKNYLGNTALDIAYEKEQKELIEVLLEYEESLQQVILCTFEDPCLA